LFRAYFTRRFICVSSSAMCGSSGIPPAERSKTIRNRLQLVAASPLGREGPVICTCWRPAHWAGRGLSTAAGGGLGPNRDWSHGFWQIAHTEVIQTPHKGALHASHIGLIERFDAGQLCACANKAPAHTAVTRTARRALPVELGMDRNHNGNATRRRTNDRRAARGNGTASSAVAPSERPVFAAHRSNILGSGIAPRPE
jgi:hypothetical protein